MCPTSESAAKRWPSPRTQDRSLLLHLRHDAKTTSVFLDFHRASPDWDHNLPATGERGSPSLTFLPTRGASRKESQGALVMQSLGSRSVVAPLGQAQRKRRMATIYLTSNTEIESRQMAGDQDFTELIVDSSLSGRSPAPLQYAGDRLGE